MAMEDDSEAYLGILRAQRRRVGGWRVGGPANNTLPSVPQGPAYVSVQLAPQGAPQMPGQMCWWCGQPGHLQAECPLMWVG